MHTPTTALASDRISAGATDTGLRRRENEDVVLVRDDLGLYAVADGAGGHDAGDVAAESAVRSLVAGIASADELPPASTAALNRLGIDPEARALSAAFHRAHRDVVAIARVSQSAKGMGSTLVAALFSEREPLVHIAHVGDSRCYRLRGGHLELLTVDHSIASDVLEKRPELDDAVLARLPKSVVTRALGMGQSLHASVQTKAVVAGDRYLLCSDGLSGPVSSQGIADALKSAATPDDAVRELIARANAAGGPDNIACVVVDCPGGADHALPVDRTSNTIVDDPSVRSSDPELLIMGIEELDLSGPPDRVGDDLIRALDTVVGKHSK